MRDLSVEAAPCNRHMEDRLTRALRLRRRQDFDHKNRYHQIYNWESRPLLFYFQALNKLIQATTILQSTKARQPSFRVLQMDNLKIADADVSQTNIFQADELEEEKRTGKNCDDDRVDEPVAANTLEFLSGYKLYLTVLAVSLAGFLYSLDVTIITTVSLHSTLHPTAKLEKDI